MARRFGRIGFGLVAIAGALVMAARQLSGAHTWPRFGAATILIATLVAAAATYAVVAHRRVRQAYDADAYARASLAFPAIGLLLTLPLAIHLQMFALAGSLDSFDDWVHLSYLFTTPTTILVAILVVARSHYLARGRILPFGLSIWGIYASGVAISCMPFVVFVLPPVLIALTGLAYVPVLYLQERIAHAEAAERVLPTAWVHA